MSFQNSITHQVQLHFINYNNNQNHPFIGTFYAHSVGPFVMSLMVTLESVKLAFKGLAEIFGMFAIAPALTLVNLVRMIKKKECYKNPCSIRGGVSTLGQAVLFGGEVPRTFVTNLIDPSWKGIADYSCAHPSEITPDASLKDNQEVLPQEFSNLELNFATLPSEQNLLLEEKEKSEQQLETSLKENERLIPNSSNQQQNLQLEQQNHQLEQKTKEIANLKEKIEDLQRQLGEMKLKNQEQQNSTLPIILDRNTLLNRNALLKQIELRPKLNTSSSTLSLRRSSSQSDLRNCFNMNCIDRVIQRTNSRILNREVSQLIKSKDKLKLYQDIQEELDWVKEECQEIDVSKIGKMITEHDYDPVSCSFYVRFANEARANLTEVLECLDNKTRILEQMIREERNPVNKEPRELNEEQNEKTMRNVGGGNEKDEAPPVMRKSGGLSNPFKRKRKLK